MPTALDVDHLLADAMPQVIKTFDDELRSDLPSVQRLLDHLGGYRGKLLRPRLLLLSGGATGSIRREHLVLAAVVEMVHMATLVHDDVLDEADLRRRRQTVNRTLGNGGAVLLGDYLISHAYHLCSSLSSTRYARRLAAVTNTVCEGELMQIEHRGNLELDEATYLEIIRRKTGALTSVCCELGALASEASPQIIEHLTAYGMELGIAFQIIDDLLDLTETPAEAGKSTGRDTDLGELTLPLIRFRDQGTAELRSQLVAIISDSAGRKSARVRDLIEGDETIEYARSVARSHVRAALGHLSCLPESEARRALVTAAEFVLNRRE